jgi:Cu/Zn superoxide dismutase
LNRTVALVALAAIISACGASGGGTAATSPSPSPIVVQAPSPSPSGLSFKLTGIDTTATGTATLVVQPGTVTIDVNITGLQANSKHVSHIHTGSCQSRGSIAIGLNAVTADGQGNADTKTTIDGVTYPPTTGTWYVVVHAGPDMQGTNATYLLCGNLFA